MLHLSSGVPYLSLLSRALPPCRSFSLISKFQKFLEAQLKDQTRNTAVADLRVSKLVALVAYLWITRIVSSLSQGDFEPPLSLCFRSMSGNRVSSG